MRLLYVIIFGILGVLARYYFSVGVSRAVSTSFPVGTFLINMLGAFGIGIVYVLGVEKAVISEDLRIGIMVGFLGGFTTFSSYTLEAARLAEQSNYGLSAIYLFGSPVLGILATFAGFIFARVLGGGAL